MRRDSQMRWSAKQKLFIDHVAKFLKRIHPHFKDLSPAVAVSGGVDSMALLYFLTVLRDEGKHPAFTALHVNHGTRIENDHEEMLVRQFCDQFQIPLKVCYLKEENLAQVSSNFEHQARELRYRFFNSTKFSPIYMAHHIDDSYEWKLLSELKSSRESLGIPVRRGRFSRPFMSVTRSQIEAFAKSLNIPYAHDPSNFSLNFERNFLRNEIISHFKERFPAYLKMYVEQANNRAIREGKSLFSKTSQDDNPYKVIRDPSGGLKIIHLLGDTQFLPAKELLLKAIIQLSSENRGVLYKQVNKLIEAQKNGKWGPLTFSGGVLAYCSPGVILLINKEQQKYYRDKDEELLQFLKRSDDWKKHLTSFSKESLLRSFKRGKGPFPHWALSGSSMKEYKKLPAIKTPHPLWPKSTQYCLEKDLWLRDLGGLIRRWDAQKSLRDASFFFLLL